MFSFFILQWGNSDVTLLLWFGKLLRWFVIVLFNTFKQHLVNVDPSGSPQVLMLLLTSKLYFFYTLIIWYHKSHPSHCIAFIPESQTLNRYIEFTWPGFSFILFKHHTEDDSGAFTVVGSLLLTSASENRFAPWVWFYVYMAGHELTNWP